MKVQEPLTEAQESLPNNIQTRCTYDSDTYKKIKEFQKKYKLAYEQDALRLIAAIFFSIPTHTIDITSISTRKKIS